MAGNGNELKDFLHALLRMAMSLAMMVVFILGEWFLAWLVSVTIMRGNEDPFGQPPLSWVKTLSIWGVAAMWGVHVVAEIALWVQRHLPRAGS